MFNNKSILSIITARGGSKGIPGKNIKLLGGKPLIAWTIEQVKLSKFIDRVIVSTDSSEIANVCREYGADIPFIRPTELANDEAGIIDVICHAIENLELNENIYYDYVLLLQPTSPFRKTWHIDEAIEKLLTLPEADSLVSIREAYDKPFWMMKINNNNYLEKFLPESENFSRRQDLPKLYALNGAIYLIEIKKLKQYKTFYPGLTTFYLMDFFSSVDIDTNLDFQVAEVFVKEKMV
jgi:CMP-N,N'-diacetyllegionaminic acid synthase